MSGLMGVSKFKPAWWLRNPHLQTLWPTFCRKPIVTLPLVKERVELPDGDFIDLNWLGEGEKPLVLILHGLEGSIESPYAKGMMEAIHQQGWRCVFKHFRGCSGEPNRLARNYHSGDTHDLEFVVKLLKKRHPDVPIAAIGFSLGGNVLLKWLGETRNQNPLTAAIAISVPFELKKTALRIQNGFSRLYQWHFLKCLRTRLTHKFKHTEPGISLPALETLRTLEEFDDKITAPLHGFKSGEEYYTRSSSRQYLHTIGTPTLIIHSKDDPITQPDSIPTFQEISPLIQLEITENGGHVGFVSGKAPWKAEYWLEQRVPHFLRQYL